MSDREYDFVKVPVLVKVGLEVYGKPVEDVYTLYLLRWAANKGRYIWLHVQDDVRKMKDLYRQGPPEDEGPLSPSDPLYRQALNSTEEEETDSFLDSYVSIERFLTDDLKSRGKEYEEFFAENKEDSICLFMAGMGCGQFYIGKKDSILADEEKNPKEYRDFFGVDPIAKALLSKHKDRQEMCYRFWLLGMHNINSMIKEDESLAFNLKAFLEYNETKSPMAAAQLIPLNHHDK